jgi:hypothetical protein
MKLVRTQVGVGRKKPLNPFNEKKNRQRSLQLTGFSNSDTPNSCKQVSDKSIK